LLSDMSEMPARPFERKQVEILRARLAESPQRIQVLAGPRQVGKTTLVSQVLASWEGEGLYVSADEPGTKDAVWLQVQWERARALPSTSRDLAPVLVIDEAQKLPDWSEGVKRLWDEDRREGRALHVVLLGSAPFLVQQGLTESLAGRYEMIRLPHWSLDELSAAFGFGVEDYLLFGAYPGAAPLISDAARWRSYVLDSLIEPTIARDVLMMQRVDKPALLRQLFELGCRFSAQELSFNKMLGQLQDAGNTTTLAQYLRLLEAAGMLRGLQKFSGGEVRKRASSPKLQVLNPALMSAELGLTRQRLEEDPLLRGRVVESAIGAHLANVCVAHGYELFYWRAGRDEVDFVVQDGDQLLAIEVKSGVRVRSPGGLRAFAERFSPRRSLIVGADGIPVEEFLTTALGSYIS
jgi:predicted AAA+ superfamily ATPase